MRFKVQRPIGMALAFALTSIIALIPASASAETCVTYGNSKYGAAGIADIKRIMYENGGVAAPGQLMRAGAYYMSNPVSQLLLGMKAIDDEKFELAVGHFDKASFLIWESGLCSKMDLEFFTMVARKYAIENGFLTGDDRQTYYNLTTGFSYPSHRMFSQDYQKLQQCLEDFSADPVTGALVFSSC